MINVVTPFVKQKLNRKQKAQECDARILTRITNAGHTKNKKLIVNS